MNKMNLDLELPQITLGFCNGLMSAVKQEVLYPYWLQANRQSLRYSKAMMLLAQTIVMILTRA